MNLRPPPRTRWPLRSPRTRGHTPGAPNTRQIGTPVAPHARGCAPLRKRLPASRYVDPARAGIRLCSSLRPRAGTPPPRARGDTAEQLADAFSEPRIAPHARGYAPDGRENAPEAILRPAGAGINRTLSRTYVGTDTRRSAEATTNIEPNPRAAKEERVLRVPPHGRTDGSPGGAADRRSGRTWVRQPHSTGRRGGSGNSLPPERGTSGSSGKRANGLLAKAAQNRQSGWPSRSARAGTASRPRCEGAGPTWPTARASTDTPTRRRPKSTHPRNSRNSKRRSSG